MAKLSHHDLHSSAWTQVKKYAESRIEKQRVELEKTTKSHDENNIPHPQAIL